MVVSAVAEKVSQAYRAESWRKPTADQELQLRHSLGSPSSVRMKVGFLRLETSSRCQYIERWKVIGPPALLAFDSYAVSPVPSSYV